MSKATTTPRQPQQSAMGNRVAEDLQPAKDIVEYLKDYARERPEAAALWCFGIGFVIGWKLKPW